MQARLLLLFVFLNLSVLNSGTALANDLTLPLEVVLQLLKDGAVEFEPFSDGGMSVNISRKTHLGGIDGIAMDYYKLRPNYPGREQLLDAFREVDLNRGMGKRWGRFDMFWEGVRAEEAGAARALAAQEAAVAQRAAAIRGAGRVLSRVALPAIVILEGKRLGDEVLKIYVEATDQANRNKIIQKQYDACMSDRENLRAYGPTLEKEIMAECQQPEKRVYYCPPETADKLQLMCNAAANAKGLCYEVLHGLKEADREPFRTATNQDLLAAEYCDQGFLPALAKEESMPHASILTPLGMGQWAARKARDWFNH